MSINMSQLAAKMAIAADKVEPVTQQKLAALAQVGVGYVKEEIQAFHAVDTGTMLNSTQADQVDALTYLVGPTVFYAPYVALGTSRVAARPFHITAAKRMSADIKKDFLKAEDLGL